MCLVYRIWVGKKQKRKWKKRIPNHLFGWDWIWESVGLKSIKAYLFCAFKLFKISQTLWFLVYFGIRPSHLILFFSVRFCVILVSPFPHFSFLFCVPEGDMLSSLLSLVFFYCCEGIVHIYFVPWYFLLRKYLEIPQVVCFSMEDM